MNPSQFWFESATEGSIVVPILLIHGVPAVFVPEGVSITGISLATVPAGWWPGNVYSDFSAYLKDWISLGADGISISERANPASSQILEVSEVTIRLSDVGFAATQLFCSEDSALATYITAEVLATDTSVQVVDTTGFPYTGVFYLDQEAIQYSGVNPTEFTGCFRGSFGSKACRHVYNEASGSGMGNSQATDIPIEFVGRATTLWMARVTPTGVIQALVLEHYGTVGSGFSLTGGGEDLSEGWSVSLDHAIKRLGQTIRGNGINVGGFSHPGNLGARTTLTTPSPTDLTPVWVVAQNSGTYAVTNLALLTGDSSSPDLGGWHPTRESYVNALSTALSSSFGGASGATLAGDTLRVTVAGLSPTRLVIVQAPCCQEGLANSGGAVRTYTATMNSMHKAWVPIFNNSRVYVNASDYSSVPPNPTLDGNAGDTNTESYFALIFGDDSDPTSRKVARIVGGVSSGGVNYLSCTAITTERVRLVGFYNSASSAPPPSWRGGAYASGFVVSEPTTARLGLYVSSDTWVSALKYMCQSLDIEYANLYDSVDWDHMAAVAEAYPSAIDTRRQYIVDLNTTLLSVLQNEALLNGFTLVMHEGRVSIARVAEFAPTERVSSTSYQPLSTEAIDASFPSPRYERGSDGIVNTYSVYSPDAGVTVNITDETSRAKYGGQRTIQATMPRSLMGTAQDSSRLYAQVFSQGVMVLGPLRYPYRHVTARFSLSTYGYQLGELVSSSLWRIPNGIGGRNTSQSDPIVVQVVGRELSLYGDAGEGHVTYTLRLNPSNIQGYAPSGLVEAGGISGDVVTLDSSTLTHNGTSILGGFAGVEYSDGGASTFVAGDKVRLVEIDSTSPILSTQHDVVSVSGHTVRLSPAPSGAFSALAASSLKVMLVYDDWDLVSTPHQQQYAFLGNSFNLLNPSVPARTFAA